MGTRIWAVEQGSYSDYRVCAVFSVKEAADQYAAAININETYELAEVNEWELLDKAPHRMTVHTYQMSPTGGIQESSYDAWSNDGETFGARVLSGGRVVSRARTPEEAKKAAYDALAEEAARAEGLT